MHGQPAVFLSPRQRILLSSHGSTNWLLIFFFNHLVTAMHAHSRLHIDSKNNVGGFLCYITIPPTLCRCLHCWESQLYGTLRNSTSSLKPEQKLRNTHQHSLGHGLVARYYRCFLQHRSITHVLNQKLPGCAAQEGTSGDWKRALQIFQDMEQRRIRPNVHTCATAVMGPGGFLGAPGVHQVCCSMVMVEHQ